MRLLKHRVIEMLGRHAATWRRLDEAITREGLWICFLWRVAPIAPYVISSAMISMTNISQWDYMWTTSLGIIPSSFPVVSGAAMAGTLLIEKKEMDPVTMTINVLSIGAGIYVMIRLGAIAVEVMAKAGAQDAEQVPTHAGLLGQRPLVPPPGATWLDRQRLLRQKTALRQPTPAPTSVELV